MLPKQLKIKILTILKLIIRNNFILKEGFSTLDIAIRIVTIFDRRQLSTVLPPEVVNLLLTLLPEEEIAKEYVKQ